MSTSFKTIKNELTQIMLNKSEHAMSFKKKNQLKPLAFLVGMQKVNKYRRTFDMILKKNQKLCLVKCNDEIKRGVSS